MSCIVRCWAGYYKYPEPSLAIRDFKIIKYNRFLRLSFLFSDLLRNFFRRLLNRFTLHVLPSIPFNSKAETRTCLSSVIADSGYQQIIKYKSYCTHIHNGANTPNPNSSPSDRWNPVFSAPESTPHAGIFPFLRQQVQCSASSLEAPFSF